MTLESLKNVRLLLLDVDGVLTAGDITYTHAGEEIKTFNVKDGLGIRLLQTAGIPVGIVTARCSAALRHRCDNLRIEHVFDGVKNKAAALKDIVSQLEIPPRHIAFVGDDLLDLPIMEKVGLAVAVADAAALVKDRAHIVTRAPGGRGAVREICDAIMDAQDLWDRVRHIFSDTPQPG